VESFGPADFERLSPVVDYFSLNSYDFSSAQKPGPNSPYPWVKSVIEVIKPSPERAGQLLMGLNFYGNRSEMSDISGNECCLYIFDFLKFLL
tara:strand:- start:619 stop:894 length:276 start_codon:yes stop_codon:yes gene_type:complete